MDDREELRRLIDVIEKGSGTGSFEQAIDDIKTFANTASFLANKLDTRLKGDEGKTKNKPKSRVGKSIASVPKPNMPTTPNTKHQVHRVSRLLHIHPECQPRRVLQRHRLTLRGLNHKGCSRLLGQVDRSGICCRLCCGLWGASCHGPPSVAANAGWWIKQDFGVQLHGFWSKKYV